MQDVKSMSPEEIGEAYEALLMINNDLSIE